VAVAADGRTDFATGPKRRTGELAALFHARIDGASIPLLSVDAIPSEDGATTTWTVRNLHTGKTIFEETVQQ